jgi:hypothetical protein
VSGFGLGWSTEAQEEASDGDFESDLTAVDHCLERPPDVPAEPGAEQRHGKVSSIGARQMHEARAVSADEAPVNPLARTASRFLDT